MQVFRTVHRSWQPEWQYVGYRGYSKLRQLILTIAAKLPEVRGPEYHQQKLFVLRTRMDSHAPRIFCDIPILFNSASLKYLTRISWSFQSFCGMKSGWNTGTWHKKWCNILLYMSPEFSLDVQRERLDFPQLPQNYPHGKWKQRQCHTSKW